MPAHNWNKILEKAQTRVESYEKRRLFMPGKILLLNVAVFCMFLPGKYFFAPIIVEVGGIHCISHLKWTVYFLQTILSDVSNTLVKLFCCSIVFLVLHFC